MYKAKALKFTTFLIVLFLLPSCNLLNSFILNVSPSQVCWIEFRSNLLPVGEWAYAQIKEVEIWEQGDDRVRLETTIQDTLQIKIDGGYISDDKYLLSDTFTLPINVLDDKGNLLGTYGEFMNLYFETSFVVGTHIATIELESTSGKKYAYTWHFTIFADESGVMSTSTPNIPPCRLSGGVHK